MISRVNCPISRSASVDSVVSWLHRSFRIKFLYFFPVSSWSPWSRERLGKRSSNRYVYHGLHTTCMVLKRRGKECGMHCAVFEELQRTKLIEILIISETTWWTQHCKYGHNY
jgi:hypothetical protein